MVQTEEEVASLENLEPRNKWMWWPLGKLWTNHILRNQRKHGSAFSLRKDVLEHDEETTKFPRTRRSFAGIIRVSDRMIKWALEAMFIPRRLNWSLDEIFFRTICELEPECTYRPLQSVYLGSHGAVDVSKKPFRFHDSASVVKNGTL